MKEEVILISGKPENIFKEGKLDGKFERYVNRWDAHIPIRRDPQYVAFYVAGTSSVRAVGEIDYKKSKLDRGIVVTIGEPFRVNIPVRFGKDTLQNPKYTTFKKLLTHESTDDL